MKYYIEYSLTSNLSGQVKIRQEYKTESEMLGELGLFQSAGYSIDDYGEIELKNRIILHLCADMGSDSYPYKKAGYDVRLIGSDIGVENYEPPDNVYGIIANPVCTEFSVVNKGFHRHGNYEKGMFLVDHCKRIIKHCDTHFWVIENPATGRLKDFLGKPDFIYHPWNFGDPWTKKTALWGKFNKPEFIYTKWEDVPKNDKLYIRPGRKKPSMACFHKSSIEFIPSFSEFSINDDMSFRSLCSQGFANAFFNVNK